MECQLRALKLSEHQTELIKHDLSLESQAHAVLREYVNESKILKQIRPAEKWALAKIDERT